MISLNLTDRSDFFGPRVTMFSLSGIVGDLWVSVSDVAEVNGARAMTCATVATLPKEGREYAERVTYHGSVAEALAAVEDSLATPGWTLAYGRDPEPVVAPMLRAMLSDDLLELTVANGHMSAEDAAAVMVARNARRAAAGKGGDK